MYDSFGGYPPQTVGRQNLKIYNTGAQKCNLSLSTGKSY